MTVLVEETEAVLRTENSAWIQVMGAALREAQRIQDATGSTEKPTVSG